METGTKKKLKKPLIFKFFLFFPMPNKKMEKQNREAVVYVRILKIKVFPFVILNPKFFFFSLVQSKRSRRRSTRWVWVSTGGKKAHLLRHS